MVLSFLQDMLEWRLPFSTLKVYCGSPRCSGRFVFGEALPNRQVPRGAMRLNPPRSYLIPSWDLSMVLLRLWRDHFEPLDSVELKHLSLKTSLLISLTSIKRVGDLQAFSVN